MIYYSETVNDEGLIKRIQYGMSLLENGYFDGKATGKYPLEMGLYANVQEYETRDYSAPRFEAHYKYIDIQHIVSGKEIIKVAPIENMKVNVSYSEEKDIYFGTCEENEDVPLNSGEGVILFPKDAHAACLDFGEKHSVRKVVIKVPV